MLRHFTKTRRDKNVGEAWTWQSVGPALQNVPFRWIWFRLGDMRAFLTRRRHPTETGVDSFVLWIASDDYPSRYGTREGKTGDG